MLTVRSCSLHSGLDSRYSGGDAGWPWHGAHTRSRSCYEVLQTDPHADAIYPCALTDDLALTEKAHGVPQQTPELTPASIQSPHLATPATQSEAEWPYMDADDFQDGQSTIEDAIDNPLLPSRHAGLAETRALVLQRVREALDDVAEQQGRLLRTYRQHCRDQRRAQRQERMRARLLKRQAAPHAPAPAYDQEMPELDFGADEEPIVTDEDILHEMLSDDDDDELVRMESGTDDCSVEPKERAETPPSLCFDPHTSSSSSSDDQESSSDDSSGPAPTALTLTLRNIDGGVAMLLKVPSKSPSGYVQFARYLCMLQTVLHSLDSGVPTTIRDAYYADVELFARSQQTMTKLLDRLCRLLASDIDGDPLPRAALGMIASPKGLFSGPLDVLGTARAAQDPDQDEAEYAQHRQRRQRARGQHGIATLIQDDSFVERLELTGENVRWVLVVEKEAVFQNLCWQCITEGDEGEGEEGDGFGEGILITGKGYPDTSTKAFVHLLHQQHPGLAIFALVDRDPYGIHILQCYRAGPSSPSIPTAAAYHSLNEPPPPPTIPIHMLGLHRADAQVQGPQGGADMQHALTMSELDRKKAVALLQGDKLAPAERLELAYMVHDGTKAEIEIVKDHQRQEQVHQTGPNEDVPVPHARFDPMAAYVVRKLRRALANAPA